MNFGAMQSRLLVIVRERVGNGEITESQLGRLVGVSQSHIHNVLKGVRKLSAELADEIMDQLGLTSQDLTREEPSAGSLPFRPVPLLSGALGRGMRDFDPAQTAGSAYLSVRIVGALRHPLAARLGEDSEMAPQFASGDMVLIDQGADARRTIDRQATYVVMTGQGPRLRYVRQGSGRIYLASERNAFCPSKWEPVLASGRTLPSVVRGHVVWVSRHLELPMAM